MIFLKKYSLLITGICFLALGILLYNRVFIDMSKNAGIAMIIVGIISIVYYLTSTQNKKH
jgi:uncharacterized membrane protein HdeD (DUF308 family)